MDNRLKLDFSLNLMPERVAFVEHYLDSPIFKDDPPTLAELSTMANYILWGRDPKTGLNAKQEGIELPTKRKTWDKTKTAESLEELLETPSFSENRLSLLTDVPLKPRPRALFSRTEALEKAPSILVPELKRLFHQIDELDYAIGYWEMRHGRRQTPPRDILFERLSDEERAALEEQTTHWNQYRYLRNRHQLVSYRNEQYEIADSYKNWAPINSAPPDPPLPYSDPQLDADIEVLPLGAINNVSRLVFRPFSELVPQNFGEEDLRASSNLYWAKQAYKPSPTQFYIDFRDRNHVGQIAMRYKELREEADSAELESNLGAVLDTFDYYLAEADLNEVNRIMLRLRIENRGAPNVKIAELLEQETGRHCTPSAISSMFWDRIVKKICEAATRHEAIVRALPFEEEFKTCADCGQTKFLAPEYFVRMRSSVDGFERICRSCRKIRKNRRKISVNEIERKTT